MNDSTPKKSTRNRAGVAELDAYWWDTQNMGHTDTETVMYAHLYTTTISRDYICLPFVLR